MDRKQDCGIEDLINKDPRAFRAFHEKYVRLYYQFTSRFLEDPEVIKDIVQDAFIAMWERVETFKEEAHVKAFLYTAIRHRAINYLRDREIEQRNYEQLARLQDVDSFRDTAVEEEVYDFLCSKIERLSPMQQDVLWLHVDGYSNEEIAKKLNISVNTVLTHKQRAKKELKSYLNRFVAYLLIFS